MRHKIEKKRGNFLLVITPEFLSYAKIAGDVAPVYHYAVAVSYARTRQTPYGDSFWIVPGTLNLH
jgi:hypothetical protein